MAFNGAAQRCYGAPGRPEGRENPARWALRIVFSNAPEVDLWRVDLWRSCGGLSCLDLATVMSRMAALVGPSSLLTLAGDLVLGVDPDFDRAALTRRATPPRLRFGVAALGGGL
jgi:hypothetical protein